MKLLYIYINHFRNINNQELILTNKYDFSYSGDYLSGLAIKRKRIDDSVNFIFENSILQNLHVLVGKTGSGKTNILQLIGMPEEIREKTKESGDDYFLIYETSDGFVAEFFGSQDNKLYSDYKLFEFSLNKAGRPVNIKETSVTELERREESTYTFTGFDIHSFADCPYADEHQEGMYTTNKLSRACAPFHRTALFFTCHFLNEYINTFSKNNIKKKASLIIKNKNWANSIKQHIDEKLQFHDYPLYSLMHKKDQELKFLKKNPRKRNYPSVKTQFIRDLLTDYALYLRKWISYIEMFDDNNEDSSEQEFLDYINEKEYDSDIDFTELPDFYNMKIEKRLEWLACYIDRKASWNAHGLVWQITDDIKDIAKILSKFDDKYFTPDTFTLPVVDIYTERNTLNAEALFDRMMQYRPDDIGIFTKELLPYSFSCISSGEYQYAKILGGLEEYCVKLSVGKSKSSIIYLLDEPETYMYPELCRKFLSFMDSVLKKRKSIADIQIILSTHSPFLLSDILPYQVSRLNFSDDGFCIINNRTDKAYFASNIHTILSDGFFLEYTIGEYARIFLQNQINWLKAKDNKQELTNDEKIHLEKIKNIIPLIGDDIIRKSLE